MKTETYPIEIYIYDDKYVDVQFPEKIPCILADRIKEVIKQFYKEDKQ